MTEINIEGNQNRSLKIRKIDILPEQPKKKDSKDKTKGNLYSTSKVTHGENLKLIKNVLKTTSEVVA